MLEAPRKSLGPSLWRDSDFLKLWGGQAISEIGTRISREGLPLTALALLGVGPAQMGVLTALGGAAAFVAGPLAGIAADRYALRPIMIAADLGRAVLLATVPWAAATGHLSLGLLFLVVTGVGFLTVFFDVSYQSVLPTLVRRDQLLDGNSKLALTASSAEIVGPGLTGILVQTLTAPRAILLDAVSFVVSAISIAWIRPVAAVERTRIDSPWREAAEGFGFVWSHALLRPLALRAATAFFFFGFFSTLYVLYAVRDLGLTPVLLGVVISLGGISNAAGALCAARLGARFRLGRLLVGATVWAGLMVGMLPLAPPSPFEGALVLGAAQLFGDFSYSLFHIHELTLRQQVTPPGLLGRANSVTQLVMKGIFPVGSLAGGVLAELFGARFALAVAAFGVIASALWLVFSPVWALREMPAAEEMASHKS